MLNLFNYVFQQVNDETTIYGLYLRKSLSNKIFLKKRLLGYMMDLLKSLDDNLDDFKRVIIGLSNIGEQVSDENQAVILLNSLSETFDSMKEAIEYGKDSLTLEVVIMSKELEMKLGSKTIPGNVDALNISRKSDKRDFKGKNSSRSKSKGKKPLR